MRLFASFSFPANLLREPDPAAVAARAGVAMGSELAAAREGARPAAPQLFLWATRDPASAPLQRLQIIKGWVEGDTPQERVYDVACSDGLTPDPATHRCPDNGAKVDPATCATTGNAGAGELLTVWTDPDFDSREHAFYYARVLENPACRWSTWDAVRAGTPPRPDLAATIQERAWSSPIWVVP